MTEGDSPTIARRRVRLALREARERAGLTQSQVAEAMEWSHSKVIRIENGDVSISQNDLRQLLAFVGVTDQHAVAALVSDARIARTRQRQAWYQIQQFRENLTAPLRKLIEYEIEAIEIRAYSIYYIPGWLQTPDYAASLMERFNDELTDEQRRWRLQARVKRREALLSRGGSDLQIMLMLDESVLRRTIGGPLILADQLRFLKDQTTRGVIQLRMVPFLLDAPATNNASFDLLVLNEGEILYRETDIGDEIIEDREIIDRHRARYEKVWEEAANEIDTVEFITKQIEALERGGETD